jgi:hypothetical protein
MTRGETKQIMALLQAGYPHFYKGISKDDATAAINLWATMFVDEPVQIVVEAVKALMCTHKYPPTIADVKEKIAQITQPKQLTEMEAWENVRKAIDYYNASEKFNRLPKLIQKVVGSPDQLRRWAQMNTETVESVIQSNFMRSYKAKVLQEKEIAMLPESTRQLISGLADRLTLKESN